MLQIKCCQGNCRSFISAVGIFYRHIYNNTPVIILYIYSSSGAKVVFLTSVWRTNIRERKDKCILYYSPFVDWLNKNCQPFFLCADNYLSPWQPAGCSQPFVPFWVWYESVQFCVFIMKYSVIMCIQVFFCPIWNTFCSHFIFVLFDVIPLTLIHFK